MGELEILAQRFALACLRLAPVITLPALSPFSWAPALVRVVVLLVLAAELGGIDV